MSDSVSESPDLIRNLLATPIPRQLWHYTSYQGFQGIVESKTIWATDLHYLNDTQEFIHAKELAERLVDEAADSSGLSSSEREWLRSALNLAFNRALHPDELQVAVASFSNEGDKLSQWRGYSGASSGVSISFDLSQIRPMSSLGTVIAFAPCIYLLSEKKALLKHAFSPMVDAVAEGGRDVWKLVEADLALRPSVSRPNVGRKIKRVPPEVMRLQDAMINFNYKLARLCPLLKDYSFFEEQEWRLVLVVSHQKDLEDQVRYRFTRNTLVPFIDYPLCATDQPIPVNGLILGPGSHPKAKEATAAFLRANKVSVVPELSKVPYRAS